MRHALQEGLSPGGIGARSKWPEGRDTAGHPSWPARRGRRCGGTPMGGGVTFGIAVEGIWVFSPGEPPRWTHRRTLARRACQPAARRRPAGKSERGRKCGDVMRGPPVIEREEGKRLGGLLWAGLAGWVGLLWKLKAVY
jgi:hypothetical protein